MTDAILPYIQKLQKFSDLDKGPSGANLFCYPDSNATELSLLKSEYQLDRYAHGRNTLEKTLSLMDWVHHELFTPGENVYPAGNNTRDIMKVRKTGALFCWFQAIVLVECLLSVGIKARVVTCIPESFDFDQHVAALVYDETECRWFFVDPTFNTYFFSENGTPLDVFAIRRQYAAGAIPQFRPITIDKQWTLVLNGMVYDTYDEWYAIYMAKNSFRFMSPSQTFYDCLSSEDVHYIACNPIGFAKKNEYDEGKSITYIHNIGDYLPCA